MIPNILTATRIFLVIPIVGFLVFSGPEWRWAALTSYLLAGVTDILDGYIARRLRLTSAFGAMFDKIADRLLTLGAVGALIATGILSGVFVLIGLLLVARDLVVASFNEALPGHMNIRVSLFEKIKIGFCYGGMAVLISPVSFGGQHLIGQTAVAVGGVMICWTLIVYGRRAMAAFREKA